MTDLELKIYEIVRRIPEGKVLTYGQVAELAGDVHLARFVGNVMHKNPLPFWSLAKTTGFKDFEKFEKVSIENFKPVPCHRVVNAQGKPGARFGMGGPEIQQAMLEKEGVKFLNGRVIWHQFSD